MTEAPANGADRTVPRLLRDTMPLALDVAVEVAKANGVCIHPIEVRRMDTLTGKVEPFDLPCGTTQEGTEQNVLKDDGIHWQLDRDHYDALRDPLSYNRKILVVLLVPDLLQSWLEVREDGMLLRRAAYWVCLEGADPIETQSKTVILPRENVFNVEQLLEILQRVGDGGRP